MFSQARPLTWGEILGFWGMRLMKCTFYNHYSDNNKNFTGDINLCSFKFFVIFSSGSICQRYWLNPGLILGTQCPSSKI